METVRIVLELILGCSTLLGFILYGKANRRIKEAEAQEALAKAEKTEAEAGEAEDHRFDTLLKLVDSLTSRLSALNGTVDKHIDRNRELSDRLYKSETELNRANGRITELTEKLGEAVRLADHFERWRCERTDCQDPRGGRPPREKLSGLKYEPPKRAVK